MRTRLQANPAVEQVVEGDAEVFLVENFLTRRDCKDIMRFINQRAEPSTLYRGTEREGFRTSFTHHFAIDDPLTRSIEMYISDLLGIDDLHSEPMQGQRYQVGQEFKHHHDFFHVGEGYWQDEAHRGGQRTWTAMLCLHEAKEGGETDFPLLDQRFKPPTGTMLVWNNMRPDGTANMKTLHAGMPVTKGIKHVITKWYRQDPWRLLN
ncbi:2OG-Fe(II) oxygenase [Erythrobacter sp. HKB08]|uniref:prolyl hydroxylase family protein n=1 Tax=Erythrobacter sp. HKB08 TaxID=2502843 RepID=UPI0013E8A773|nr:2OG-Fe(II) oxygenase [Erythrobacter sp. HKB08]